MFRKSALAMAMLGALTTGNVVALGLGNIDLKSHLNQPFHAEVELLSATDAELDKIKVALASSQAFANAGIERPMFLTKLKFSISKNTNGRPVLKISSSEAVREPFLDFLLEVSWGKGRLLREYTVLVDPQVTMPAAAPVPIQQKPSQVPVPHATTTPRQHDRTVAHTTQIPPVSAAPGEYLTKRSDTLWSVAQQVRPDTGVSIEQTMLGLLNANPGAFYNNNINSLKASYNLWVPNRDELTLISKAEAAREVRAQYAAWQAARSQSAQADAQAASTTAGESAAQFKPRLQLLAANTIEGGDFSGGGQTGTELDTMQRELMMANEALEAQGHEIEDLSGRFAVLEEQVFAMQRLMQLKDTKLALLQSQVGRATPEQLAAEPVSESVPSATPPGIIERLLANPLWLGAGAVVLALLAFIGLRRRRGSETQSQERILQVAQSEVTPTAPKAAESEIVTPKPASTDPVSGESSKLSQFAVGEIRIDPLAQVDAYLTYGRYQQAEDLIKEALESAPEREDLKLKLLEIFQAAKKQAAFDELAQVIHARTESSDNPLWQKVAEMGREISPGNLLYLPDGESAVAEDQTVQLGSVEEDIDFKFDAEASETEIGAMPELQASEQAESVDERLAVNIDSLFDSEEDHSEDKPDSVVFMPPTEIEEQVEASESELNSAIDSVEPEGLDENKALDDYLRGLDRDDDETEGLEEEQSGALVDLEVSTKLDLARVYIDMGDSDGAKCILDEVMYEGNEDQKHEAQGILKKIA